MSKEKYKNDSIIIRVHMKDTVLYNNITNNNKGDETKHYLFKYCRYEPQNIYIIIIILFYGWLNYM